MSWTNVFSVETQSPVGWSDVGFVSIFVAIGLGLALVPNQPRFGFGLGPRALGVTIAIIAFGLMAVVGLGTYLRHASLVRALNSIGVHNLEGVVTNFRPMPDDCHVDESFDVSGQHFKYRDCRDEGGFNNSSTYGGPMRAGERVRIAYRDGVILKLQIGS